MGSRGGGEARRGGGTESGAGGRTISCSHPTPGEPGEEGESHRLGPRRQPRAFRVGPPRLGVQQGPLRGETGLGGGGGVVTAAGTRGWGQDGVSSPCHPPTPQDEQPGVCSQISLAWVPRAHPTGTPPLCPLPGLF